MALKGFSDIKTSSSSSGDRDKFPRLNMRDHDGSTVTVRPVGPVYSMGQHWIERRTKDGTKAVFPAPCANYDPKTDDFHDNGCPWCKARLRFSRRYHINVIDREEVENEPKKLPEHTKTERKAASTDEFGFDVHFKDPESKSWTPVKILSFPVGTARDIGTLEKTKNTKTSKKTGKKVTFSVGHHIRGFDIDVLYQADRKAKAWDVSFSENTELSDEELEYLYHDLSTSQWMKPVDIDEQIAEFNKIKDSIIYPEVDEDDEPKKKKKRRDDDDDEAPKKSKSKRRPEPEDDDEDDDDEEDDAPFDDDDDEDDEPPRKKKSSKSKPVKKSKKRRYDDDDDEDDNVSSDYGDDEDDDDDQDDDDDDLDF